MDLNYDYIVVGGGTAGVTVASRLKQYLPSSRIALLEAGPNATDHPMVNDASISNVWFPLLQTGLVVDYSTTPQEHLNDRAIPHPAGRMLSGASAVNVGTWMRPSAVDCDLFAERAGSEKFRFGNMLKYFKRLETWYDAGADAEYHGSEGMIHTVGGRKYPLRGILQETAEKLGHAYNSNTTRGDPTGLANFVQCFKATSDSTVARQHSARVYDLSGVDILCDTPVARILLDDSKHATGVELLSGKNLFAAKEVIVCCGTQRTPQLLMLSGIGPHDELSKHGIPVLVDAPAVGTNLVDHSAFFQTYKLKDASLGYAKPFTSTHRPEYTQGMPIDFTLSARIAPDELAPHLAADGLDTRSHDILAPKRTHFMSLPIYDALFPLPHLYPSVAGTSGAHIDFVALHMLPLSRGTVTLASPDPAANPIINPRFLSTHTDRFIMRRAVRENIALASTAPLADVLEGEVAPVGFEALGPESSDEQIDERVRAFAMTISHPMGTCAVGTVLDGEFKVKGVEGLRVCDASVFPEPVAAMPSCMVYALGEMCAEIVAGV
jgi:choline dehydrogenase-like flavoprotein